VTIRLKRAYDAVEAQDGRRILVERLWPRGLSKEKARIDFWARDTAPSNELRTWYSHDAERWAGFRRRYFAELDAVPEAVATLRLEIAGSRSVTFVYGSRETVRNSANALRDYMAGAAD
jgi:uncharacterized protein YeaO (DUF488 family)